MWNGCSSHRDKEGFINTCSDCIMSVIRELHDRVTTLEGEEKEIFTPTPYNGQTWKLRNSENDYVVIQTVIELKEGPHVIYSYVGFPGSPLSIQHIEKFLREKRFAGK